MIRAYQAIVLMRTVEEFTASKGAFDGITTLRW
jgi:hypothetical protein